MRLCLVSSPTVTEFDSRVADTDAVRLISEQAPIGILTLAAILRQVGITVEVVDLNRTYYRCLRTAAYRHRRDFCAFVARGVASRAFFRWGVCPIFRNYSFSLPLPRG